MDDDNFSLVCLYFFESKNWKIYKNHYVCHVYRINVKQLMSLHVTSPHKYTYSRRRLVVHLFEHLVAEVKPAFHTAGSSLTFDFLCYGWIRLRAGSALWKKLKPLILCLTEWRKSSSGHTTLILGLTERRKSSSKHMTWNHRIIVFTCRIDQYWIRLLFVESLYIFGD